MLLDWAGTFAMTLARRIAPWVVTVALLPACGSRTGLDAPSGSAPASQPPAIADAGIDVEPPGATADGAADAGLPCSSPVVVVYALDPVGGIHELNPLSGADRLLGAPQCGNDNVQWTMTATRDHAFIVYTDWTVYEVSLGTLACTRTPFDPSALGLSGEFGVAAVGAGGSERLFAYGEASGSMGLVLGTCDTTSYALSLVGVVAPPPGAFPVNLTADEASWHLFAYAPAAPSWVLELDAANARVLRSAATGVGTDSTWATVAYEGELFLWADSRLVGYDLAAQKVLSDHDAGFAAVGASAVLLCK
jgi:hypothetical protein